MMKQSLSDKNVNGGVLRTRSTLPCNGRLFTQEQIDVLEPAFKVQHYPDILHREQLALELNVPEVRLQVWFQDRRKKFREVDKIVVSNPSEAMRPTGGSHCLLATSNSLERAKQYQPKLPTAPISADKISSAESFLVFAVAFVFLATFSFLKIFFS
ncbi:unnamed protein product [Adineta ricciae]|uniref:Homeobox domain-containing protein n=1 Tax=Adineta ricciae TaxID=249248 RepID=A0A814M407_ADIRI|nr:unnamed protein product [Adineta ricciae]CAF1534771.1 unnamed protein product [Adineta ricciae]